MDGTERFETVIVGGGQAGLSAGYHLKRQGRPFVILDASERIGDAWRKRWDSLRVFTPAKYDGLGGYPFPAKGWSFPTKDEMADYLQGYAARFELPVRSGTAVDGLRREGDRYVISAGDRKFEADNVVVASGAFHVPKLPAFATQLDPGIVQLHSSAYVGPSQLREGPVLVVGAGNSGAEIAPEVSRTHQTLLAGKAPGQIPVRHGGVPSRVVIAMIRFLGHRVLTTGTPVGRKVRPNFLVRATPLIRTREKDLAAAGVERGPKVAGTRDGQPVLEDDRVLEVANVIWCTGFRLDYSWIELPVFSDDGQPLQDRGVVQRAPGLYFLGLEFLYAATSGVLPGIGRDAEYVARHIAARERGPRRGTRMHVAA
ncbi:MAG: flavin-containing monooxygenase [Actinomycetota bacterium]